MKKFKAGEMLNQGFHKSFIPNFINRKWELDDMEIQQLLSNADRSIGRLDMYSEYIPNIDMFIGMHIVKEATKSSKIEGTQTNMEDMLQEKENISEEKRDDWEEVNNYIKAMNEAIIQLDEIPFSTRLIKKIHQTLMQGVRGKHKLPGEYRTSQNWIGGASISDAVFVPPPHTSINELMGDIEKFVHNDEWYFPDLLKVALMHYQFETIHPFLDGNGRVGRLLITLYLVEKRILSKPILYLSDFFEKNRQLYYDNLMNVRLKNDLKQWVRFFLVGIIETADSSINTFKKILDLKKNNEELIQRNSSRAKHLFKIMDRLYVNPVLSSKSIVEITNVTEPTAYKILEELESYNILRELTGGKRGRLYMYQSYVDIF